MTTTDQVAAIDLPEHAHVELLSAVAPTHDRLASVVVWVDLPTELCGRCEQTIGMGAPLPVLLTQSGEAVTLGHHQHSCGEWNIPDYAVLDAAATDTAIVETAAALLATRSDHQAAHNAGVRAELLGELTVAMARLGEPLDAATGETAEDRAEEVSTSDGYTRRGVLCEHGTWMAWAPTTGKDEGITVTTEDLPSRP